MKLFIIAALIAVASAARLEHLERGYLPPSQNNYAANSGGSSFPTAGAHGNFGFGNQGSQYKSPGRGSNGFDTFGRTNDFSGTQGFGGNGLGNGFGNNGGGSNGFGAFGRNGGSSAATSNQYLPPNYGGSGSGSNLGSSIRPSCSTCGSSIGSPQRYQQAFQGNSIPSAQYGSPQFSSSPFQPQQTYAQEPIGASRQYLAPKPNQNQQPFDENTGYIY